MFCPHRRNNHDCNYDLPYSLKVHCSGTKRGCDVLLDVDGHQTSRHVPRLGNHTDFKLGLLQYSYDALEPFILRQIMELHHKKHHQTYVNALITAEASYAKSSTPRERIALQAALKFNGGGHINHSLFWKNLAPASSEGKGNGGSLKAGPLKDAIEQTFGSLDVLKKSMPPPLVFKVPDGAGL
ncbi:Iron/manganese superoxide dismutase [Suillus tomentosus]|nr:Iron/manganese superoxide dismutase [Suillus tomentosus]